MTYRYAEGYRIAEVVTNAGRKILGISIGVAAVIELIGAGSRTIGGALAALVPAAIVMLVGWVFSILVSAQGQLLKGVLDGAVNSSPFLTNEQRAKIMSPD
jgi:hypothetical protein